MVYLGPGRGWCSSWVGPVSYLCLAVPPSSSTSTPWPPLSSRRCFSQIQCQSSHSPSCSMTGFHFRLYPPPPHHLPHHSTRFSIAPSSLDPSNGSLSPSSIKVNQSVGRQTALPASVCEWMVPKAQVCRGWAQS